MRARTRPLFAALLLGLGAVALVEWLQSPVVAASPSLGCRLLPNAAVSYLEALDPGCPLLPYERIDAVVAGGLMRPIFGRAELDGRVQGPRLEVQTSSGGERRTLQLPVDRRSPRTHARLGLALGALLLGTGGALLWSRRVAALPPLSVILGTFLVYLCSGSGELGSSVAGASWIAAGCLLPAAITHLALVFPRERRILERAPLLVVLPYALAGILGLLEWILLSRQDRLWELPDRLSAAWILLATISLGASSYLTFKESESMTERAVARALIVAAAAVAGLLLVVAVGIGASLPVGPRRTIAVTSALMLGALAYAGAPHAGFDAPRLARWTASFVVYTGLVATSGYLLAFLGRTAWGWRLPALDPVVFVSVVFAALVTLDQLRRAAAWLSRAWVAPGGPKLESIERESALRIASATDPDRVLEALAEAVARGLSADATTGFVRMAGGRWRLAAVAGSRPFESRLAAMAEELLREQTDGGRIPTVLELRRLLGQRQHALRALRSARVEVICAASADPESRGMVLVGALRRSPDVSADQRRLVEELCTQAGYALARAELAQELLTHTRMAALGHAASGLAHDLGRPLGEIYLSARQAASAPGSLASIRELASECLDQLDRFAEEGKGGRALQAGSARLELVLEAAADRIGRLGDGRRPVLRFAPRLPVISDARNVQRVVENLIENAMYWSPSDEPVELVATVEDQEVVIRVLDRGPGLDPSLRERVFEPFYSTRAGTGLGLTICRDIVSRLDGTIALESAPGEGSCVTVALPLERSP